MGGVSLQPGLALLRKPGERASCKATVARDQIDPDNGRLHQMDGMRGLAMLFVFLGHFVSLWSHLHDQQSGSGLYLRIVEADATLGSSMFMLLSAFFSYGSLLRGSKPFSEFLSTRLWRLYPLYVMVVALYVGGSILIPRMSKLPADPEKIPIFLVETLLFLPGLLPIKPLIDVAWTLSFVVLFYFVGGAVNYVFGVLNVSRASRVFFLCSAFVAWTLAGDHLGCWEPRTAIFWIGMALAELMPAMTGRWRQFALRSVPFATALVLAGVWLRTHLLLHLPPPPVFNMTVWTHTISVLTLSALLWICYFGPAWWKAALSMAKLCRLGEASYSFYLTHGFTIKLFRFVIVPHMGTYADKLPVLIACTLLGLAVSIWVARFTYDMLEKPLANLARRRQPQPVAVATASWAA